MNKYVILFTLLLFPLLLIQGSIAENGKLRFDTIDVGPPDPSIPTIQPWKVVHLDAEYGGLWVVAGDLDGDGTPEIVSCENFNDNDVHHTTTAVAHRLDGSVMWKWGNPSEGRKIWHHDVACQIHDWDGDGQNEVILCAKGFIVELDGKSGKEKRRIPIPDDASDCLVFCDLSGTGRPSDVLVKNRYHQIWAYDRAGELLWTVRDPGGFRTAHQPRPIDLDGDGRDEIMAGYAMLNPDGNVRWVYQSKSVDPNNGHLDCMRVLRKGSKPEDFRLAITCCGANNIALIDGNGSIVWEKSGHHFESIDIGKIDPNEDEPQILVDIDHKPLGESPMWAINHRGETVGKITADYCRHHKLLDWTGDGLAEIFVAHNRAVYDNTGKRIATLAKQERTAQSEKGEDSLLLGDMTGDGIADVLLVTPDTVSIFKNESGEKPKTPFSLGTGLNLTLY